MERGKFERDGIYIWGVRIGFVLVSWLKLPKHMVINKIKYMIALNLFKGKLRG